MRNLILALDTGGTNTDAVVYDTKAGSVLASAKDYTTHHDLSLGLAGALEKLALLFPMEKLAREARAVHLSTTLATNAIAEGQGHRVGLVMIGFDQTLPIVSTLLGMLPAVFPIFVAGGHDYYGREDAPLDEDALIQKIGEAAPSVSAWAVSGFFSVKNPAHELRAADIIQERHPGPVTMGRSLSGELGAMRRAATAALNAGLVLIINRLLDAVSLTLRRLGIGAPVMVVQGDGGLVGEAWARARPIETVVSGPAAGLVGAMVLAKGFLAPEERDLWVLDVGGTTSDLASLKGGRPSVSPNGAKVGKWHTMVEAVETKTRGLGGDSLVEVNLDGEIVIGPRRVLPLCRLCERHPEIVPLLGRREPGNPREGLEGSLTFFIPNLPPGPEMGEDETEILKLLKEVNPLPLAKYQSIRLAEGRLFAGIKVLTHPAILVSAFTPTDAMSVLGLFGVGAREASLAAAQAIAARYDWSAFDFCRKVLDSMGRALAEEIASMALAKDGIGFLESDFGPDRPLGRMLDDDPPGASLSMKMALNHPVIMLGAPAGVLAPFVSKRVQARVLAPPSCQVASAVGAAASSIALSRRVDIVTLPDFSGYRAFLPEGLMDGVKMEDLISEATEAMRGYMLALAKLAGSDEECQVGVSREDREARLGDGTRFVMGASLTFTAASVSEPA
ncbi:MAG: hydantoinase/oxoprolinase family protein [Deltaproteobacteria bacterium]|nr:hydantoinase/oxoprolinase family protein [Deltaproteobacteria bacterium]